MVRACNTNMSDACKTGWKVLNGTGHLGNINVDSTVILKLILIQNKISDYGVDSCGMSGGLF
jgi:hypothetical protein